jgi:sugar phosphate isomerase/epimerase
MTATDTKIADRQYDARTPLAAIQRTAQNRFTDARAQIISQARAVIRDMEQLASHAEEELHVGTGGLGQQADRLTEYVTRYEQAAEQLRELDWFAKEQRKALLSAKADGIIEGEGGW